MLDTLTSAPARITAGGVVAAASMPPADNSFVGQVIHYGMPLLFTFLSHLLLTLLKPKSNDNSNSTQSQKDSN
jgi:hypothetical protein